MPAPVQAVPPKPPVQKAIPAQAKPAEKSDKPDDFKQALQDATRKSADAPAGAESKKSAAKPEAKRAAGKSANKAEGKAKSSAAKSSQAKRPAGKRASEPIGDSTDASQQDPDLELASAIAAAAAQAQTAAESNPELPADSVPADHDKDGDGDAAAHPADADLTLADAAAAAQLIQPVERQKDQPSRDSKSDGKPQADNAALKGTATPAATATAATAAPASAPAPATPEPAKSDPKMPSAPQAARKARAQAAVPADDAAQAEPNDAPAAIESIPAQPVALRNAAQPLQESTPPVSTDAPAKQSPGKTTTTAPKTSDVDIQADPLIKAKPTASPAVLRSAPDADPASAVDAASAFAQLADPDTIAADTHSKETDAPDVDLDPSGRVTLDPGASHATQPAATTPTKSLETNFHIPQSPEDQFADANHDKIVTAVRGELLPHGGSMQIRLDPPELGALKVMVEMRDGVMNATFQTSNEQATQLLSHSLNQLKHVLESQGVNVERLQVEQAPRSEQSGRNGEDGQRQQEQQRWSDEHAARQEQQRKEMLRRMWRKVSGAGDPIDFLA